MTDNASPQPYHVNLTLQSNDRNSSTIRHRTQALFGFLALVVPAAILVLVLTVRMGVADSASPLPVPTGSISSLGATSIITPTHEWVNLPAAAFRRSTYDLVGDDGIVTLLDVMLAVAQFEQYCR